MVYWLKQTFSTQDSSVSNSNKGHSYRMLCIVNYYSAGITVWIKIRGVAGK